MLKLIILVFFMTALADAETTKTVFNPFTQKLDFITAISTNTSLSASSITLPDSLGCLWQATINTAGIWLISLLSCPTSATGTRPCTTGIPLGLLAAITCP